uniref:Polyprotein n=1 Tax=Peronospora matthiolae TaxID=2874970 RepID=A0AAV1UBQ4_9STRA
MHAWVILRDFYNRTTLHNRVEMTRRLHEFKMENGSTMSKHLDAFDELVVGLQTLGEPVDDSRQLVVLLSSLPTDYELISSIVENSKDITLIEVKEKLLKQHERLQRKETTEKAFPVSSNGRRFKGGQGNGRKGNYLRKTNTGIKGKCFKCGQVGHYKRDCLKRSNGEEEGAVFADGELQCEEWLIDSRATSHMTPHRSDLFEYKELKTGQQVSIADGKKLQVAGVGTVKLKGLDGRRIMMVDVMHIPGLDKRLLSVGKLAGRGMRVEFQSSSCIIWSAKRAIASGKKIGKAYFLDCEQEEARLVEYAGAESEWELWHARLGHPGRSGMDKTQRATSGMPAVKQGIEKLCSGCMKGKLTIDTFPPQSLTRTSLVLELVHTDVMGPMKTVSKGGARFVLTFVDDYSRFVAAYFMKHKSEVAARLSEFKAFYENQWGKHLKCIRSDNGTEFVNKKIAHICARNGIVHQRTVPYSPQQNGVAERINRTIMEKARSMLYYKGIDMQWWAEAVSTAVYLINRSTNSANSDVTPFEVGFKMKPSIEHLRVFGSQGYAHIDDAKRTKLEPKSYRCMFLGYSENTKGYRVFNLERSKVVISRSVKLDEREVEGIYDTVVPDKVPVVKYIRDTDEAVIPVVRPYDGDETMEDVEESAPDVEMDEIESAPFETGIIIPQVLDPETQEPRGDEITGYQAPRQAFQEDRLVFQPEINWTRRSRDRMLLLENGNSSEDTSEGSDGPPSPKRARIDDEGLIAEAVLANAASVGEADDAPSTYRQALKGEDNSKWIQAMQAELKAHADNGSWTLVPKRQDIRPIGCRWIFAKKRNEHGQVVRYKARLVANGFKQKFGVDFFETYSPVANMKSIRVVLAVVVTKGYVTEQLDVDTAFLNSDIKEEVYMEVPNGIANAEKMMCKLDKAIYGLKQAASAWNKTIHAVFLHIGFRSSGADQCIYVKHQDDNYVYVCLYVDDMIIAAKTSKEIQEVKTALKSSFRMKELGKAKFILGVEIDHDHNCSKLMIRQTRYIDDVASRFNQEDAKAVINPCESGLKLSKKQSPTTDVDRAEMQSKPYRSLVGCLLYITTCTRPDVMYVITQLSRFLENPGQQHWKAAIRVLRYLKTTRDYGIIYDGSASEVTATAYTDADWGSNIDDRRSVSGIMVIIGGAPAIYKSKYQRTVALISAEAEYMALSLCTQEVLWVRALLKDLGHEQVGATWVWEDNQGVIGPASNAGYNARTKHVDIRHHFIRENVAHDIIVVKYISTMDQLADMLTKALGTKRLNYLIQASCIGPQGI